MVPVMLDEISTGTVHVCTAVTALCRTYGAVPVKDRPDIRPHLAFPPAQVVPDSFQIVSCHEEQLGVFREGNT